MYDKLYTCMHLLNYLHTYNVFKFNNILFIRGECYDYQSIHMVMDILYRTFQTFSVISYISMDI